MPKQVSIRPTKGFKSDDKDLMALHKTLKPMTTTYQTALENVRNSKGAYEIAPETPAASAAPKAPALEDMPLDDLKVLMLQVGVKTEKQMTREQVIGLIRKKLSDVEIVEAEE